MSFSTPSLSLTEMLHTARRYGYQGIEPRLDAKHAHGVEVTTDAEQRKVIREQAREAGVELACLATSLRYADPSIAESMVSDTHERIDLAADVGAPVIRVFGGKIAEGLTREQAIELVAQSLAKVANHAARRGVTVCVETHDDWCAPADVAAVLRRVDHPAVAVNWDIMHPVRTAKVSIDSAFETLKPWIRHLHIHDGIGSELAPIGTGTIDHRRVIELLKGLGYTGFLSGEWINWEPYEVHLPRELAAMKAYEYTL